MKTMGIVRVVICLGMVAVAASQSACERDDAAKAGGGGDVTLHREGTEGLAADLAAVVEQAPVAVMQGPGLVGVTGGARVKLLKSGRHEVLLPLPQITACQVPVAYAIRADPVEAAAGFGLRRRDASNVMVKVRLDGKRSEEIGIRWAAVVLVAGKRVVPEGESDSPDSYLEDSDCVQSGAPQVTALADKLWPEDEDPSAYAAGIQQFIRGMNQARPPRSMDAVGILASGANWICTANANLAAALMRAKGVPARTLAVVPPTGQRLEMHRVVEFHQGGAWVTFDPSSLQAAIPAKPWQNLIMARTTMADEKLAMKPRPAVSLGCPYGHELELTGRGVTLSGQDFFWTVAKPLAEFSAEADLCDRVVRDWRRFLESGSLSEAQRRAASARDEAALRRAFGGE